jgi:hypothetical protein
LVRNGARSVTRELGGQIRTVFGGNRRADVWDSATSPHSDEGPECAWCPHCRARRLLRESGPGIASQVAAAADTVTVVMQDALSAFEAAMAAGRQQAQPKDEPRDQPPSNGAVWDAATGVPAADPEQPPADETRGANEVWGEATGESAGREMPTEPGPEQPPTATS